MAKGTKIKIAFCTDGIFPHSIGGIQRHSALLLRELANYQDLEIHVLHPHDFEVFQELNLIEHFIKPIQISRNYLLETYKYSQRISKKLDKIKPDIIYAQGLTVWKNAKKYRRILINNPHGLESFQAIGFKEKLIGFLFKMIQRKIFKNSKYIASEGGHLTDILKNNGFTDKIVFLPNAVELPTEFKLHYQDSGDSIKVFFMARFVKNKGIHILFDAVQKLSNEKGNTSFHFMLGGKGPLFEYYKKNNAFSNVDLLGFLSDEELKQKYLEADIFLLPTLFEGMPTVVLEAMSFGLPVIVSDVGGTSELINEETGYLIKRNDSGAVCDALKDFSLLTSDKKKILGENARKKVAERFTWKKLAKMHHDLFIKINQDNWIGTN